MTIEMTRENTISITFRLRSTTLSWKESGTKPNSLTNLIRNWQMNLKVTKISSMRSLDSKKTSLKILKLIKSILRTTLRTMRSRWDFSRTWRLSWKWRGERQRTEELMQAWLDTKILMPKDLIDLLLENDMINLNQYFLNINFI